MRSKKRSIVPPISPHLLKSTLLFLTFFLCLSPMAWASITVTFQLGRAENTDIAQYKIFCRRDGNTYDYSRPAWKGPDTSCTITMEREGSGVLLEENVQYYFVARAVDKNGNESGDSNEVLFRRNGESSGDGTNRESDAYTDPDPNPPEKPIAADGNEKAAASTTILTPLLSTTGYQDADTGDDHARTQWRLFRCADDVCVFEYTSKRYLTELKVPQLILEEDTDYYWIARFFNNRDAGSPWSEPTQFTTGFNAEDANQNGIPDAQEIDWVTDLDQDGTDDSQQDHIKCVNMIDIGGQMGISTQGEENIFALEAVESIPAAPLSTRSSGRLSSAEALIAFRLLVAQPGDTARIRIHLSKPLPPGAVWYHSNLDDVLRESAAETVQTAEDRMSVTLEIEDGGIGDNDGVANGVIVAKTGYGLSGGEATAVSSSSSSDGGYTLAEEMSCFIQSLLSGK